MTALILAAGWVVFSVPFGVLVGRYLASQTAGGTSSTGEWSSRQRNTRTTT